MKKIKSKILCLISFILQINIPLFATDLDESTLLDLEKRGINQSSPQKHKDALLYIALVKSNAPELKALLYLKADIEAKRNGLSPLLHIITSENSLDLVQILIQAKANVNAKSPLGMSLLHLAAYNGKVANLKALLEGGARTNILDSMTQETPLHVACQGQCYADIVEFLLKKKANPNLMTWYGETALDVAYQGHGPSQKRTIELLLHHGGTVNKEREDWD